ncbi:MAG: potassium channel family protein [Halodesulfurarchaeum sp.]
MALWRRRALITIFGLVVLVILSSFLYHAVIIVFEGRSQAYSHSLQVVIETYTGTGYGSDSPWEHPVVNALVSIMDLSTFLLLFIVVPYVFRPVLESALSPRPPTSVEKTHHVVVLGVEHQKRRLIDEFENRDVDYVVVTDAEDTALELIADDVSAIYGDPTSTDTLRNARVDSARAVVVDTQDDRSASAVLALQELDETIRTVVLVENLEYERHLLYAGADLVLTQRHVLGRRIGERISTEISPIRTDSVSIGEGVSVLELSVFEGSPICGKTIGEIGPHVDRSASIIGLWRDGSFVASPEDDTVIDEETSVLVVGETETLRKLEEETYRDWMPEPRVVVAGYGIVGSTVASELGHSSVDYSIVDLRDADAVDVVGDATREETLREAGIPEASIFVVALGDDVAAIMSILVADELNGGLDIICRMNESENVAKARRAGADYVLSLPEISGRFLAEEILHEEILSINRQLKIVRIGGEAFAGCTLDGTNVGEQNCVVVGVERDGDLVTNVSQTFEFEEDDDLLVVGSDEDIDAIRC